MPLSCIMGNVGCRVFGAFGATVALILTVHFFYCVCRNIPNVVEVQR